MILLVGKFGQPELTDRGSLDQGERVATNRKTMAELVSCCPRCYCAHGFLPTEQCALIQTLVRPEEVRHFVRRAYAPATFRSADNVGSWLTSKRLSGEVIYIPDPPGWDRWCSPAETLRRGGGDCDDLSILAKSLFDALGPLDTYVSVGRLCQNGRCEGHAWIEGNDEGGWFLLEATNGQVFRNVRPSFYTVQALLRPGECRVPVEVIQAEYLLRLMKNTGPVYAWA